MTFCSKIIFPTVYFSFHCSTKNIGFNDSGYVIKPLQASSSIYGAPPITGNPN